MPKPKPLPPITAQIMQRLWKRVDTSGDCWLWTGPTTQSGYGVINIDHGNRLVHRVVYQECVGPIPDGLTIDHLCRTRACVNPVHLEAVTQGENVRRGQTVAARNAAKTHCKRGHALTPDNLYIINGARCCKQCNQERRKDYRVAMKQERASGNIEHWQRSLTSKKRRTYPCGVCLRTVTLPVVLRHPTAPKSHHGAHVCLDCFNLLRLASDQTAEVYTPDMLANLHYQDVLKQADYIGVYRQPRYSHAAHRREEILAFIRDFTARHGRGPYNREIAEGCGFASTGGVGHHIARLVYEGRLKLSGGKHHSLTVIESKQGDAA